MFDKPPITKRENVATSIKNEQIFNAASTFIPFVPNTPYKIQMAIRAQNWMTCQVRHYHDIANFKNKELIPNFKTNKKVIFQIPLK